MYFIFQDIVINSHVIKVCIKLLLPLLLLLFDQTSFPAAPSNLGMERKVFEVSKDKFICYSYNTPSLHNPIQMQTRQVQAVRSL